MGKIKVTNCDDIEGLKVIEPTVFGDSRGYFMETYNYNDFAEAGIDCQFVQDKGLPWKWNELVCPLCYYTGGSYKQTVGGRWVHTLCAVWASEIKFGDEIRMRNISGLEAIPDSAFKYKCCACHKTGSYCIKVRTRTGGEA